MPRELEIKEVINPNDWEVVFVEKSSFLRLPGNVTYYITKQLFPIGDIKKEKCRICNNSNFEYHLIVGNGNIFISILCLNCYLLLIAKPNEVLEANLRVQTGINQEYIDHNWQLPERLIVH